MHASRTSARFENPAPFRAPGTGPSRAVLIVHRPPTSPAYSPGELATLSAFAMQLQVVFSKLLAL